jgi:arginyl-tRNA synthetase
VALVRAEAFATLEAELGRAAGAPVELERPSDPSHGDYATTVALRLAKKQRRPPREIAQELADSATALPDVVDAQVAGPGFVNLWLGANWYGDALEQIVDAGERFGAGSAARRERVQVEMVSANPTGPITVASARNGAYGDSVARLLEFAGHDVEREYYYNDAGAQMEKFRASVEARRRGEEPPEGGYHGAYIHDLAELGGDPVAPMLEQIERSLERFRIHFDTWALQSELQERLPEFLPRLDTYEQEGAVWARSSAYGDEQDRVLLRSGGGAPTYRAADVVYLADKLGRGFERAVYVLGADHHGTRNWYAAVARMLGYDPDRVEVLLYQFVHVVSGGETAKMGKRSGNVVPLDDLVEEIGVDAARWYLIDRGPDRTIDIDVDLATERSRKNPVYYVQYLHARTHGVFREARTAEPDPTQRYDYDEEERAVVKRLVEFPAIVSTAAERRAPQLVTDYAIRLADDFHRFYQDRTKHKVVGSPEQGFRLALTKATQTVIAQCLSLVGVDAPERM